MSCLHSSERKYLKTSLNALQKELVGIWPVVLQLFAPPGLLQRAVQMRLELTGQESCPTVCAGEMPS